jgi:hypothetical protein
MMVVGTRRPHLKMRDPSGLQDFRSLTFKAEMAFALAPRPLTVLDSSNVFPTSTTDHGRLLLYLRRGLSHSRQRLPSIV